MADPPKTVKKSRQETYNPYNQPNPDQIISLQSALEEEKQKKPIVRRTVDYHTTIINYLETRAYFRTFREFKHIYATSNAIRHMRPIPFERSNESHGFCTKYVSTSINKHKCAINCLTWSPEGRRLITGNAMGQFTLWNGLKFNFDTILPAHEFPIRRMIWKYDDEILLSSDARGYIKYWTTNMKNLRSERGHDESINDMCFSPTYSKFASASADGYLKIWDFASCKVEQATRGHGWDVTCLDWHSSKGIVASGSKDNLIKLWCPRSGECLRSLHGHKNTVACLKLNRINGNWMITGSKDQLIKIWDLRMLQKGEYDTIRADIEELSALSWHPHYEKLFVAGGKSGDIKYFVVGNAHAKNHCQAEIHKAHEQIIWDFAWHPMGHILASSSNDQTTRFWTRNRPGDDMNDQYNVNQLTGASKQAALRQLAIATKHNPLGTGRTSKPLTEIGGVNLEEIINTEENVEVADDPLINDAYLHGGKKRFGGGGSSGGFGGGNRHTSHHPPHTHPSHSHSHSSHAHHLPPPPRHTHHPHAHPYLPPPPHLPPTAHPSQPQGTSNIHPERMRQMDMPLPGLGGVPPPAGAAPPPPPPAHYAPPPNAMYGVAPPPPHTLPHPHPGVYPMQAPPPAGPPPGPYHHPHPAYPRPHPPPPGMMPPQPHPPPDGMRFEMDRDRERDRAVRERRMRRDRDRERSRSRERDRKKPKGSTVPGLNF